MSNLTNLINQISDEMKLTSSEKAEFNNLVSAWESELDTMAVIEPDDDYSLDRPRLEELDVREEHYADMRDKASKRAKEAFDTYLGRRNEYVR